MSPRLGFCCPWGLRETLFNINSWRTTLLRVFGPWLRAPRNTGQSEKGEGITDALGNIQPGCLTLVMSRIKIRGAKRSLTATYSLGLGGASHGEKLISKHRFLKCFYGAEGRALSTGTPRCQPERSQRNVLEPARWGRSVHDSAKPQLLRCDNCCVCVIVCLLAWKFLEVEANI